MNLPEPQDFRLETYRDLDQLRSLIPAWEQLLAEYPHSTTFSTWEWLCSWWQNFGSGQELFVVGLFEGPRLVGLAPLSVARKKVAMGLSLRSLRFMGDGSGDSDNLDLPVRPGYEEIFARQLLRHLRQQRSLWDICELNTLPPCSSVGLVLFSLVSEQGWVRFQSRRPASSIPLPASWAEYLARLSSEDQKNLLRYSQRLGKRYRVRIYRCAQQEELPRVLDAMFRLHQARWQEKGESGSFGSAARRNFYQQLSILLLARKCLELWVLELNDEIASAQFAFRYRDTVFQLQEGNDPARSSDRVGFILRGEVLKQLIAEGVRVYDFLGGQPGYKARWGAVESYYWSFHFARKLSWGGAILWSLHSLAGLKQQLRKYSPAPIWNALHRLNLSTRRNHPANHTDQTR